MWAGYFLYLAWGGAFAADRFALLSLTSVQVYGAGMALNDFVDYERDTRLHPARPLPSGRMDQGNALLAAALLLFGGALCAMSSNVTAAGVAFGLVVLVLSYNLWTKTNRWLAALNMALLRAGNLLLGMSPAFDAALPAWRPWLFPVLLGVHTLLLTLLSTYEDDPFAAGAVRVIFLAQLLVLALPVALLWGPTPAPWLAAAWLGWFAARGCQALRRSTRGAIPFLVVAAIRGIILLDAGFVFHQGQWQAGATVLALLIPAIGLSRWFRGS